MSRIKLAMWGGGGGVALLLALAFHAVSAQTPDPVVSVTAGDGVTEGGDATFTITASSAPAANLSVSVTVSASGDYGAATGQRTVTIPTTGSVTLTVGTTNDRTDESDGSVTATLDTPAADAGYTVSATQGAATVAVSDDDVPEVSISGPARITEGESATFNISVDRTPATALTVNFTVVRRTGTTTNSSASQTATIPAGERRGTLVVSTTDDALDQAPRTIVVTVNTGTGYTPAAVTSGGRRTVILLDNDTPEISITAGPGVNEGGRASFTLTANPVPAVILNINFRVSGDYAAFPGRSPRPIILNAGDGSRQLRPNTIDDALQKADGTVTVTLIGGSGYAVSSSANAATVAVRDNEPDPVPCRIPTGTTEDGLSFGGVLPQQFCLDVEVGYADDVPKDADGNPVLPEQGPVDDLVLNYVYPDGTYPEEQTFPIEDLKRRPGDLYAQRLIYDTPVGPDGADPNLARWTYAHEVCGDEGFECTWTSYKSIHSGERYTIAQDLVVRCAENFRCSINFPSQRHSSTSTVRVPAEPTEPPLRPRNERVVSEAEGRQLYRIRVNHYSEDRDEMDPLKTRYAAVNKSNDRDAARYRAVYEAACLGGYHQDRNNDGVPDGDSVGIGVGVTCEFFDHYYDDHVDAVPAQPGPDGELGTDDDVAAVEFKQGTHIGTTLVVTCLPGYTCDLDLTFVREVPGNDGPDEAPDTEDDVAPIPAHYTASFTATFVEPRESAPRPIVGRASRATVGSVSVRQVSIRNESWDDANSDGVRDPGEVTVTITMEWRINGQPNTAIPSGAEPFSLPVLEDGRLVEDEDGNVVTRLVCVFTGAHDEDGAPIYSEPNAQGLCEDLSEYTGAPDQYSSVGVVTGSGNFRTITQPHIPEPQEPACLIEWRAAVNRGEAGSNAYGDYCTEKELDDNDRAQEQYAADVDATYGVAPYDHSDPNADDREPNPLAEEGHQGTYERQVEQLEQRGEPYYECISEAIWLTLRAGVIDRCSLVYPVQPAGS